MIEIKSQLKSQSKTEMCQIKSHIIVTVCHRYELHKKKKKEKKKKKKRKRNTEFIESKFVGATEEVHLNFICIWYTSFRYFE